MSRLTNLHKVSFQKQIHSLLGGFVHVNHPADPPDAATESEGDDGDDEHKDPEFAHGATAVLGKASDDEDVPVSDKEETYEDDDEGLIGLEVLAIVNGLVMFVLAGLSAHSC